MKFWVGTSGWSYKNWQGIFYPKGIKSTQWLSYYADHCNTVELNSSFYRLPNPKYIENWANNTPDDFLFAVKAWGLITHRRRLIDCQENIKQFLSNIKGLKNKCGPILFQLPYSFHKNFDRLKDIVGILPKSHKYCFEFRHPSWWDEEVYSLLNAHNISFCIFEIASLLSPRIITGDFIYVRLHGYEEAYKGRYSDSVLLEWKEWIKQQAKDTYFYFDNTMIKDDAIQNAQSFYKMLSKK
jgi:uncharacterized protein YecE (DUF72 family)